MNVVCVNKRAFVNGTTRGKHLVENLYTANSYRCDINDAAGHQ